MRGGAAVVKMIAALAPAEIDVVTALAKSYEDTAHAEERMAEMLRKRFGSIDEFDISVEDRSMSYAIELRQVLAMAKRFASGKRPR